MVLGLLAALENVIPPLPTDAAVALGAFLSHRGVTTPLGVAAAEVGVKAKTNEGMGFIGRGEGLAVVAVATLEAR